MSCNRRPNFLVGYRNAIIRSFRWILHININPWINNKEEKWEIFLDQDYETDPILLDRSFIHTKKTEALNSWERRRGEDSCLLLTAYERSAIVLARYWMDKEMNKEGITCRRTKSRKFASARSWVF